MALGLHLVGTRLHPAFPLAFDIFLVVLVSQALDGDTAWALLVGVVIGFAEDTLQGRSWGLYGCADTIVAYLVAVTAQRVVIQRASGYFLAFFAASIAQQTLLLGLAVWLLDGVAPPSLLWVVTRAATCGLIGVALQLATERGRVRLEGRRRQRGARLGFERRSG